MSYMTKQQTAVLQCIASCPGGRATAIELAQRRGRTVSRWG